jgi:hypothetical protein
MINIYIRAIKINAVYDAASLNVGTTFNLVNKAAGEEEQEEVPQPSQPPTEPSTPPPLPPGPIGPGPRNHD